MLLVIYLRGVSSDGRQRASGNLLNGFAPPIAQVATDLSNPRLRSGTDIRIVLQMLAAHCGTYVSSNCKLKKKKKTWLNCSPRTKNRFTHRHPF